MAAAARKAPTPPPASRACRARRRGRGARLRAVAGQRGLERGEDLGAAARDQRAGRVQQQQRLVGAPHGQHRRQRRAQRQQPAQARVSRLKLANTAEGAGGFATVASQRRGLLASKHAREAGREQGRGPGHSGLERPAAAQVPPAAAAASPYRHAPACPGQLVRRRGARAGRARQVGRGGARAVQVGRGVKAAQQVRQEGAAQRLVRLHQLAVQRGQAAERRGGRACAPAPALPSP
jgi:hypothetical protein